MSDFTFEGVETNSGDFEELPDGTYVAMIEKTEVGTASTGTPQLRCQFRVIAGDYKNRVISDWLYFSQKAAGVVLGKIQATGIEIPSGLPNAEAYAAKLGHLLVPRHAEIVVRSEEYNGVTRAKVKGWKRPPEGMATNGSAAPGSASAPTDDDIPFHHVDFFDAPSFL